MSGMKWYAGLTCGIFLLLFRTAQFYIQFDDGIGMKFFLKLLEWTLSILAYAYLGHRVSICMMTY